MNRLRFAFAALIMVVHAGLAHAQPAQDGPGREIYLTNQERDWLSAHPEIRVAPDPAFAPIEFIDQAGAFQGMAADYLALVEEKLGVRIRVVPLKSWDAVLNAARAREVDMLSSIADTPERSEYLSFTAPHIRLPGIIVTSTKTSKTMTLEDLRGKTVAVVSGYFWAELLQNRHPEIELEIVPDIATGLLNTSTGSVDAMIGDPVTTQYFIAQKGLTNLRVAGQSGYTYRLGMAARSDWPQLASILDKALAAVTPQEHADIEGRWMLFQDETDTGNGLTAIVAGSLGVFILVLVVFFYWNRSLRRKAEESMSVTLPVYADTMTDLSGNRRKVLVYSIATMAVITLAVTSIADYFLYDTAFEQQRESLVEAAQAQARLIDAIARFDRIHSTGDVAGGSTAATLNQIIDAHQHNSGIGETGEFTLARIEGNEMVFILERRHPGASQRVPLRGSLLAEPMRRALSGRSGTIVAQDYRGEQVLAAYEPVAEMDLGIVAKIDVAEIRRPFARAGLIALAAGAMLVLAGGLLMVWLNNPLIKRVEDRERRLKSVVGSVPDAIITLSRDGTIDSFSHAGELIFGYDAEDVVGRHVSMLTKEADIEGSGHITMCLQTDGRDLLGTRQETLGRRTDGSTFPMEVSVNKMTAGPSATFVLVAHDITERAKYQAALLEAREVADSANQAKSAFLANMSHELRTPMNAIIGYSEMLIEEAEDLEQEDFIPDLKKVKQAGEHLLALINDILDLSKVEAGKMELYLEVFDVSPMLDEVTSTVQSLVVKNGNELKASRADDLGSMSADLTKLRQTLFNLISNAAKFTKDGVITISARREHSETGDWICFSVTDTGIGVEADKLEKLFDEFTQADASTTRQFGGTGLGLAISQRFCHMMGGDISVESTLGEGSTFTIRIPADVKGLASDTANSGDGSEPDETGREDGRASAAGSSAATILVIDDDAPSRDLLERSLTRDGFAVVTATSGAEGMRLAREIHPAAITLDVMMPGADGWAVLKELKTDPHVRDIPVVMVTIVDNKELGYALGAVEYLTKPVDRDRLSQIVRKYRFEVPPSTVLLVEDDEEMRDLMRRALEKEGWVVTEAVHGRAALDRLTEQTPAMIILDLMMPVMDGFEFVLKMREVEAWCEIPVVVITAKDLTAQERQQLSGNVERILEKGTSSHQQIVEQIRSVVANGP